MKNYQELVDERITDAVSFQRIRPVLQPIVNLDTCEVAGFEVLARWADEVLGCVSPLDFIPAAQRKSLLGVMTSNLMQAACHAAQSWSGDFYLAFNVPPALLQDNLVVGLIEDAAEVAGFPLRRIRVEMTELEIIENELAAEAVVRNLKSLGVKVLLDDFGTGFSSMTRLHRFEFDEIKIDGSFVRNIETDPVNRKIVSAVIGLGHSLGIQVIAECIETQHQLDFVRSLGCDYGQGWLLGHALALEDAQRALGMKLQFSLPSGMVRLSPYRRQQQLQSLYVEAPVGLCFVDMQKNFLSANAVFCQMIGRPLDSIIGRSIHYVYGPDDAIVVENTLDAMTAACSARPFEFRLPNDEKTYLVYGQRVSNDEGNILGLSIVSMDISDLRRAERKVKEGEGYKEVVELSPTMMWVAEADGTVSYISPMPHEPAGFTMSQRLNGWYAWMDPQDRIRVHREWLEWLPSQQMFSTRFRVRNLGGSVRWILSRAKPQIEDGITIRWYGVFTDITREYALENKLYGLGQEVDAWWLRFGRNESTLTVEEFSED